MSTNGISSFRNRSRTPCAGGFLAAAGLAAGLMAVACSSSPVAPAETARLAAASTQPSQGEGPGNTPAQLTRAGWNCQDVPGHGVHCTRPSHEFGSSVSIPVKVYDTSDPGDDDAPFLGTESLIRADRYHGQPCLPGHGSYSLLPFGYYACHHFDF